MNVEIHPDVCAVLKEKTNDIEKLVNDILFIWAQDGFFLRADVEGMFVTTKILRKNSAMGKNIFDEITKDFKGVVITGRTDSEALFIPDVKLHDMLKENQVLLVMKSGRTQGIRTENTNDIFVTEYDEN